MPIDLTSLTDTELIERGISPSLRRSVIQLPLPEEIAPTPQERYLLEVLGDWQELSLRSPYVLGISDSEQPA